MCVDDDGRVHIDFAKVPNTAIAHAIDTTRSPHLDDADGPLAQTPPARLASPFRLG
ncbi:hypothetical protein [Streptomyces sp. NPDC055036]